MGGFGSALRASADKVASCPVLRTGRAEQRRASSSRAMAGSGSGSRAKGEACIQGSVAHLWTGKELGKGARPAGAGLMARAPGCS